MRVGGVSGRASLLLVLAVAVLVLVGFSLWTNRTPTNDAGVDPGIEGGSGGELDGAADAELLVGDGSHLPQDEGVGVGRASERVPAARKGTLLVTPGVPHGVQEHGSVDWDWLRAQTSTLEALDGGVVELGGLSPAEGAHLWTWGAGCFGRSFPLLADGAAPRVAFEPCEPVEVRLTGDVDTPGGWVEVRTLAQAEPGSRWRAAMCRRIPLEEVLNSGLPRLVGRSSVRVERGERQADWTGDLEQVERIELSLSPTATCWGRVEAWPGAERAGSASVHWRAASDSVFRSRGSVPVLADGTWEVQLPIGVGDLAFQLESQEGANVGAEVGALLAGERREVPLTWTSGATFPIEVFEAGAARPVPHAVVAWFMPGDEGPGLVGRAGCDADGRAVLRGLHHGQAWFYLIHPQFSPQPLGPLQIPWTGAEWCRLAFTKVGRVHGRVLDGGEPLREFTVVHWDEDRNSLSQTFRDRADGTFELQQVPVGQRTFLVQGADGFSDRSLGGEVTVDRPLELAFEMGSMPRARGRALSGEGLAPLADAEVIVNLASDGGYVSVASTTPVGPDGRFEGIGFPRHEVGISVVAPGHISFEWAGRDHPGDVLDLGDVVLRPAERIRLQLTSAVEDPEWSRYRAEFFDGTELEVTGDGRVELEGLDLEGGVYVRVLGPNIDSLYFIGTRDTVSGGTLRMPVATGRQVRLHLDEGIHVEPGATHQLSAETLLEGRGRLWAMAGMGDARECSFGMLPEGWTCFAYYHDQTPLARAMVRLPQEGDVDVTLRPIEDQLHLRLVDSEGRPVDAAVALLKFEGDGEVADIEVPLEEGVLAVPEGGGERFWLHLWDWSERTFLFERLERDRIEDGGEVVVDVEGELTLRLVERGAEARGVGVVVERPDYAGTLTREVTGAHGEVAALGLSEGPHVLRIDAPGYWSARFPIELGVGARQEVLEVRRTGNAELRVSRGGVFVPGVATRWTYEDWGEGVDDWLAAGRVEGGCTSDELGRVRLAGLPNGRYRVEDLESGAVTVVEVPPHGEGAGTLVVP